ncbi:hypothetical protein EXU57_14790 [Segetibacter sp. 3557_3]|uniref:hypothetical protein n=1 Tax=Segetibacter sp. 3557_3 TaxID=2547429 RepID=UPI001058B5C8|nr:hypothetical protein [Segetibacter sp. 3557_3]TDH24604.1 hypothetical protein EXU57_14790 [Segetibacter sp. 3557_3]
MKYLTIANTVVIAAGLLTSISIVRHYSSNGLVFTGVPYAVLFALACRATFHRPSFVRNIAALITSTAISVFSFFPYYDVSYGDGHSSTEGIIFGLIPLVSVTLIPVLYLLIQVLWVLMLLLKKRMGSDAEAIPVS